MTACVVQATGADVLRARFQEAYEMYSSLLRPVALSARACTPEALFDMVGQLRAIEDATARLRGIMPSLSTPTHSNRIQVQSQYSPVPLPAG